MTKISGGQAAVEALKAEDTHVFGLIGSATMEMFDALHDAGRSASSGCMTSAPAPTWPTASPAMSGQAGVCWPGRTAPAPPTS